jgi:hypothetical protein
VFEDVDLPAEYQGMTQDRKARLNERVRRSNEQIYIAPGAKKKIMEFILFVTAIIVGR